MSHPAIAISSVKLAWALSWTAFWTGFPFKVIVALLLLAAQIHPWEGGGLVALLVAAVPIDIWAVGLTARTIFIERLGIEVRGPAGIALWWQGTILGAVVLGAAYFAVGAVASVCQKAAAATFVVVKKVIPVPIAEQITIELLMWAVPAAIVAIVLLLVWLKLFGWRIKRFAATSGQTTAAGLQERVREWDHWRVPSDPVLMLVSFTAVAVLLTVVFWVLLPVTTPHRHPDYPPPQTETVKKKPKPDELLKKTETTLAKAEAVLESLEEDKAKEKKKPAGKGK